MEGLGRLFDLVAGVVPVDLDTANGATGNRVNLKNAGGVTIVVFKAAGTAGEDPDLDVQQHDAASAGNSKDLDVVTHFYKKEEATLDGDETWSKVAVSPTASEVDLGDASAEVQGIYVIEVESESLDHANGFNWISLNVALTAATPQLGSVLYILRDLNIQRAPANLVNPQAA